MAATTKARKPKGKKPAKARKPKAVKATTLPQDQALADIARASLEVQRQWDRVERAEKAKDHAAEILKGAKADHLEATKALVEVIADLTKPNLYNAKVIEAIAAVNGTAAAAGGTAPAASTTPVNPDAWKSEPLSVLVKLGGFTEKELEKIESKMDLRTVGDLAKFLSDGRSNLTDLPGIGEAKLEKIQDAMEAFWKLHPEATQGGSKAAAAAVVEAVAEGMKPDAAAPAPVEPAAEKKPKRKPKDKAAAKGDWK